MSALVAESASLRQMLWSIGERREGASPTARAAARDDRDAGVRMRFELDQGSIVHIADVYMCQWTVHFSIDQDLNVVSASLAGMAKAHFAPDHTLASLDLRFDVLALSTMLNQLADTPLSKHHHQDSRSSSSSFSS